MKYSADNIVIHNWAKLTQTTDGKWTRTWNIVLKEKLSDSLNLGSISQTLSHEDFQVNVEIASENSLEVCVITQRWGWEDNLYFSTYKMFEELNSIVGDILTIQGQDRNLWDPWLYEKLKSENKD
jgi:hypothetical protein